MAKFINKFKKNKKMKPWIHLLISSIIALLLYPLFGWKVLFILAGGVLIDIDHYLWYIYKFRKFSLRECYKYFEVNAEKNKFKDVRGIIHIFHIIEFFLLAVFLSFFNDLALLFTIGLFFHYILDIIHRYYIAKSFVTSPSITLWIYKNKIQKCQKPPS